VKIAICFSGMMRNFENTFPRFKKFIMDNHEPDIFFSGYPNNCGLDYCLYKFTDLYKPKKFIINEYTEKLRKQICDNEEKYLVNTRNETKINNFISQIYNIKSCDDLRQQYENENNFQYDVVIRTRLDVFYFKKFDEEELNLAKSGNILIPTEWDFKEVNPIAVSDSFAMSNSTNMTKYANLYNNFDKYFQQGIQMHPETMFGFHILQQKLNRIAVMGHGWCKFENIDTGDHNERRNY
jgi:hypothetical protein